jgi:hypothetical protein
VKAIVLAALMALAFLVVMTVAFRTLTVRQKAAFLTKLWLVSVPILVAVYLLTPPSLGLLPEAVQDDPGWFGPIFCVGLWFAGFFGGLLQLYNLTERGMSLRMLIDVAEAGERGMTVDDIMTDYSQGQGITWMYQKRLDGLLEQQMVRLEDGMLINDPRGRRLATMFSRLRRVFGLGAWT